MHSESVVGGDCDHVYKYDAKLGKNPHHWTKNDCIKIIQCIYNSVLFARWQHSTTVSEFGIANVDTSTGQGCHTLY